MHTSTHSYTYMSSLGVIRFTNQFFLVCLVIGDFYDIPKHQWWDSNHHDQHPHSPNNSPHNLPGHQVREFLWEQHSHHPVDTHQRDQKDGGVHVGVAQVEQAFAHGYTKDPLLLGQVNDEEDGEDHDKPISKCKVEDEEGGNWASFDASQDAPDDEKVAGDTQQEDQAEDEGTNRCGEVVVDSAVVLVNCGIFLHVLMKSIFNLDIKKWIINQRFLVKD